MWTGEDARAHGLIDRFGGWEDAVERARELAHLPRAAVWHARPHGVWGELARRTAEWIRPAASVLGVAPSAALRVVWSHEAQPLALLPWSVEPR